MKRPHFALPEIYDDSLSYYDVLRKLIKSMHEIVDNLNKIPEQIANEAKERLLGDQNLQQNINTEVSAREQGDTTLQQNINSEATTRERADQEIREGVYNKISELKGDLANKLPKSPTEWEEWTAEEQAMARLRMGMCERLIFSTTLTENASDLYVTNDINGNKFNLSEINIYIYSPVSVNGDPTNAYVSVRSSDTDSWNNHFGAWTFKSDKYEGIASAKFVVSEYHRPYLIMSDCIKTAIASRTYQMISFGRYNLLYNAIVGIRLMANGTFETGTKIVITGVDK